MARYNLIVKDEVYVALWMEAKRRGIPLGKLINEILSKWADRFRSAGNEKAEAVCILCGKPAAYQVITKAERKILLCEIDLKRQRNFMIVGFKRIERPEKAGKEWYASLRARMSVADVLSDIC